MDKNADNKNYKLIYMFMYLLYIIVLLPKMVQMGIIVILLLYLLKKNKFRIPRDKISMTFALVGLIQMIAIAINSFSNEDVSRIAAAINTASLWIIGGIFYSYIKNIGLDKDKVNKAMFINMCILITLSLFMILCMKIGKIDITIMSKKLMRSDWAYGEHSYRLRAFLLYDTLVPMFFFTIFPFAFEYVHEHKNKLFNIVFLILSILPVYLSKSRMGILLGIILFISIFPNLISKVKKKKILIISLLILGGLLICAFNYQKIYNSFYDLMNSRGGSTSARKNIYETSINKVLNTSPVVGCGIKEMIGDYPLGSHSTYIGLLYKVGVIGLIVGLLALFNMFKEMIKTKKYYYIISGIALSLMFITEDLDGEDWLIILFSILYGLIAYRNCHKTNQEVDVND